MTKHELNTDDARFVLDGRELHGGEVIELALEGGIWVPARWPGSTR
jgi:hypothetical protein